MKPSRALTACAQRARALADARAPPLSRVRERRGGEGDGPPSDAPPRAARACDAEDAGEPAALMRPQSVQGCRDGDRRRNQFFLHSVCALVVYGRWSVGVMVNRDFEL